jgi:3-phenylpropionate/trans-cinnamate dioxygenase ferredoxin reductase subunit
MSRVIIVGGGQAGSSMAAKLRTLDADVEITLIAEESDPPYQRPPLSKAYLMGEMARERLYLRPAEFYADQDIKLRLGTTVTAIDPVAKVVETDGETLSFDHLALTTGSVPNRLPAAIGGNLDGVYTVRSLADVDQMSPLFQDGARVLVVGGGYIGLEAAAVAAKLGLNVTLVEMTDRILGRVAAPETADAIRAAHLAHGVDIREGVGLDRLIGEDGSVTSAALTDGSEMAVDFVIVGTGIRPDTRLAEVAGITCDNGISVDEMGQTSVPGIWAAGDCACFPYRGGRLRLESVQNAIDQAEAVAANILGAETPYVPKPWFWSDQYDLKLQIAGLNTGYDRVVTRNVDGVQSFWYFEGDRLLAVDAISAPRDYMVGKRLIEMGKSPDPDVLMDPDANLKELLKS